MRGESRRRMFLSILRLEVFHLPALPAKTFIRIDRQKEHVVYYGGHPKTYMREDPWRRGKYQVGLEVEFPGDLEEMNEMLEEEGFYVADLGQWGKTYFSRRYPRVEAELEEIDEYSDLLRLSIKQNNLEEEELPETRRNLYAMFERTLLQYYGALC